MASIDGTALTALQFTAYNMQLQEQSHLKYFLPTYRSRIDLQKACILPVKNIHALCNESFVTCLIFSCSLILINPVPKLSPLVKKNKSPGPCKAAVHSGLLVQKETANTIQTPSISPYQSISKGFRTITS